MGGTLIGEKSGRNYGVSPDGDSATRIFLIRSDDRTDYGPTIIRAPGVPRIYDYHPDNPSLQALDIQYEQDADAWWKWTLTVEYSKPEGEEEEEPWNREPESSVATESFMVAVTAEVDASGNPEGAITNSAGEPYDPPPETEEDILIINIARNELNVHFSVVQFYAFTNSLNADVFNFGDATFQPGQVKLKISIGKKEFHADRNGDKTYYRPVTYLLACNPRGWDWTGLDRGSYYMTDASAGTGASRSIPFEVEGERTIGLLDGQGGKLPDGAMAVFLNKRIKRRVPFSVLNLPSGP